MFASIKKAGFAAALVAVSAATAQAQIYNTGVGMGPTDPNWGVSWNLFGTAPDGVTFTSPNGAQANATVITTIPTPPWNPNNQPNWAWIGVTNTGTMATLEGNPPGDNIMRFSYNFTSTILGSAPITGAIGWDNRLLGYSINGGAINSAILGSAPNFDEYGFCRDSDGEFDGLTYPNCTRSFTLNGSWSAGDIITIHLEGDGRTDGLLINQATVPEPSTYALMAAGLAGLFAASRRRRKIA